MSKKKNTFLKNLNYLYKKKILVPFLNKSKEALDNDNLNRIDFIKEINSKIDRKITNTKREIFWIEFKEKIKSFFKSLKPAKKELWINEFRSFLMIFCFVLLFT